MKKCCDYLEKYDAIKKTYVYAILFNEADTSHAMVETAPWGVVQKTMSSDEFVIHLFAENDQV